MLMSNTVSAAVSAGFATARAVMEDYATQYMETYAQELELAKYGVVAATLATAYAGTVVAAYCTGELLGLPRGWVGRGALLAVSPAALSLYATVGAVYAAAGTILGFKTVHRKLKQQVYKLLPEYVSPVQEQRIFAVVKRGQLMFEPLGGGAAEGPVDLPGLDAEVAASFEYEGTIFFAWTSGRLSAPLLNCHPPSRSSLWRMMDWSAQAVFAHNGRTFLIKDGLVWHDMFEGGDLKGPEQWPLVDNSVQGAYMEAGRFYVLKGGRAYHEKIGGGNIAGPETWPLLDDSVQDAFVAGGRFFVVKNGQLWHEKLGGGDIVGPETRGYLDWAVTACWEQDGRAYFVRGGKVEHFALPFLTETPEAETLDQLTAGWHSHTLANKRKGDAGKSKAGPAKLLKTLPHDPTCVKLGDIQAMWTLRDRLYMVSGGKVYHQPIGGGAQSGPESWDIIDDTVQAAYVADERLYVIKGGKVFHAAASQAATAGVEIVGPEAWPLVDGEVQAALVTTDAKLGIARYVTDVGKPLYVLNEMETGQLLADIVLEQTRSVELAHQVAAKAASGHLTGTMLATCTMLDLMQDYGLNAPTAKTVSGKVREYKKTGVPDAILKKK
mmetsp:Transcript_15070/g.38757  ORF Transcript_15070/g.38757 Transcript_15070/m.38757 type:complete len:608 (-) Transcript_15070:164-1987(-)|eukprot:jgi/Tetstr1/463802/TSEL_008617.t1